MWSDGLLKKLKNKMKIPEIFSVMKKKDYLCTVIDMRNKIFLSIIV